MASQVAQGPFADVSTAKAWLDSNNLWTNYIYNIPIAVVDGKGHYTSIFLDVSGLCWGWGYSRFGELGANEPYALYSVPISVAGTRKTFCKISGGNSISFAIDYKGKVWSWGYNNTGQLGIGSTTNKSTPTSIMGANKTFCFIDGGKILGMALDYKGQVWTWGFNNYGQLGINQTSAIYTPIAIGGNKKTFCSIISAGYYMCSAIDYKGQVWGWGYNNNGQLGDNTITAKSTPVSILGIKKTFCKIHNSTQSYTSVAIDKNGQVWAWGLNTNGQIGDNTITSRQTPVSILGNKKTFCYINTGEAYTIALDKYGQVWTWGLNTYGQLGVNSVTSKQTPVSILGNKKTFCKISAGDKHVLAVDKNGKTWSWGYNLYGELGTSNTICYCTPVMITTI